MSAVEGKVNAEITTGGVLVSNLELRIVDSREVQNRSLEEVGEFVIIVIGVEHDTSTCFTGSVVRPWIIHTGIHSTIGVIPTCGNAGGKGVEVLHEGVGSRDRHRSTTDVCGEVDGIAPVALSLSAKRTHINIVSLARGQAGKGDGRKGRGDRGAAAMGETGNTVFNLPFETIASRSPSHVGGAVLDVADRNHIGIQTVDCLSHTDVINAEIVVVGRATRVLEGESLAGKRTNFHLNMSECGRLRKSLQGNK